MSQGQFLLERRQASHLTSPWRHSQLLVPSTPSSPHGEGYGARLRDPFLQGDELLPQDDVFFPDWDVPDVVGLHIFSKQYLECSSPKAKKIIDMETGEVISSPYLRYDPVTRSWIPTRCTRNTCVDCSIMNARRVARAIWLSRPTYVLCLTQVGSTKAEVDRRLTRFFAHLRKAVPTLKHCWAVEPNPEGTGNHLHGYLHTGTVDLPIPEEAVEEACNRAGIGSRYYLKRVPKGASVSYFAYPLKALLHPAFRQGFLALNGTSKQQKIVHSSQTGFWRDGETGETLRHRSDAESLAIERSRGFGRPQDDRALAAEPPCSSSPEHQLDNEPGMWEPSSSVTARATPQPPSKAFTSRHGVIHLRNGFNVSGGDTAASRGIVTLECVCETSHRCSGPSDQPLSSYIELGGSHIRQSDLGGHRNYLKHVRPLHPV